MEHLFSIILDLLASAIWQSTFGYNTTKIDALRQLVLSIAVSHHSQMLVYYVALALYFWLLITAYFEVYYTVFSSTFDISCWQTSRGRVAVRSKLSRKQDVA